MLAFEGAMHALVCPLCRIALPRADDVCRLDGTAGHTVAWLAPSPALRERFELREPFAHGKASSLYVAEERATGRRGLLKLLTSSEHESPAERARVRRELAKQATLTSPHLLLPYASGESGGSTWLFREQLAGLSLEVRLAREGVLAQHEALAIAGQLALALDVLHGGGLLHHDIKPGHIFLLASADRGSGGAHAVLLDAGVASRIESRSAANVYGTAGYVAPELLSGKQISFRSDLYSLGCVLYRMLTGHPAFPGETLEESLAARRYGELPPPPSDLPHGIGDLLQSVLAKDPQKRPMSAQKLCRILAPFLPSGALMEKQPTTIFETVSDPEPASPAPEASDSLWPTAPADDGAQPLELDQLEELVPARRTTPQPPPLPPEAMASSAPARARPDETQPIRLDQILAVVHARRASSHPPPALRERPPPARPRAPDGAAELRAPALAATQAEDSSLEVAHEAWSSGSVGTDGVDLHALARSASGAPRDARDEQLPASGVRTAESGDADAQPARPSTFGADAGFDVSVPAWSASTAQAGASEAQGSGVPESASLDPGVEDGALAAQAVEAALAAQRGARRARELERAVADDPGLDAPDSAETTLTGFERAAPAPAAESAHERSPREDEAASSAHRLEDSGELGLGRDSDPEGLATESIGTHSLPAVGLWRGGRRQLLVYGSAAVVLLAAVGVGASALRSSPEKATASNLPPSAPAGSAASPSAEPATRGAALAEAPRPLVEPLANSRGITPTVTSLEPAPAQPEPAAAARAADTPAATSDTAAAAADEPAQRTRALDESRELGREPASEADETRGDERGQVRSGREQAAPSSGAEKAAAGDKTPARSEELTAPRSAGKAAAKSDAKSDANAERDDKAGKTADKAARKAAALEQAHEKAKSHYTAKRFKEAEAAYERASRYDPRNAGLFAGLGASRLQLGDNKGALEAYKRAVQLAPDKSGFHAALGHAQLALGEKAGAKASYEKALALDPKNSSAKRALRRLGRGSK